MNFRTRTVTCAFAVVALTGGLAPTYAPAGDRALGEYLSSECVTCHQLSGHFDGIPPIIGWPPSTFVEIMDEYRNKTRENQVMQTIAARLSSDDVAALAAYFGSLKPSGHK
jgi:cytochrome c553